MEVTTAARRELLNRPAVTGHVVDKIFRDVLETSPQGTGGKAIVISKQPGWARPDTVKTAEYPVLWIDCYADVTREDDGEVAAADAPDKAMALARTLDWLHGRRGERWGAFGSNPGLMVVTCARWAETRIITDADRHKSEPPLDDMVIARTVWALQVAHG